MNKKDLISFENEIASLFNKGKIRAPVHLYKGNEEKIINVFKNIALIIVLMTLIVIGIFGNTLINYLNIWKFFTQENKVGL